MAAALLTGLRSFVDSIKVDPDEREGHLSGFQRLKADEVKFVVLSSLVSYVSDAALAFIFEDTRVALRADEVKEAIVTEVMWLAALEDHMWHAAVPISRLILR